MQILFHFFFILTLVDNCFKIHLDELQAKKRNQLKFKQNSEISEMSEIPSLRGIFVFV